MVRLVVITDRRLCSGAAQLARLAELLASIPGGSVAVQVREKDLDGAALLALTRGIIDVARPLGAEVWVNDRADVALAAGADGVHLPERGLSIADARALASSTTTTTRPALRIGCSRHSALGALAAARDGADRIHLGPIWSTPSKQAIGAEPIGVDVLSVRRQLPRHVELVAVGGIDSAERAAAARRAGADAIAVIRAAWSGDREMVSDTISALLSASSAAS